jgi:diguanylate cyclase (GGDEF)-like protein
MVAVVLIDLYGFKRINDSLGHATGDHLLEAVAARLSASVRGADTACRHGGDEFVIMLPEVDDLAMADSVVAKVPARLCEPHVIDGREIRIARFAARFVLATGPATGS